jgi:FkbM family methyltransferase
MKQTIKKIFNTMGFDIIRFNKSPQYSLLGLKNLPVRTIIDVGANTGQFAKTIKGFFPEANIYCFEPIPVVFQELSKWTKNKNNRAKAFNLALGDSEKEIDFFHHQEHSPSSSILKTTNVCESIYPYTKKQQPIIVHQTTLDKAIDTFNIPLISEIVIKLDVQGYEDKVINGGQKTFAKAKACILEINLDLLYESQPSSKDLFLSLYNQGYRYIGNLDQTFAKDGHVIFIDTVFVK